MSNAGRYGIKSVKGPSLTLPAHPQVCELAELESYARGLDRHLAIDLFSGAGGTSLGLERAGFEVVLGVDMDDHCVATHRAHFGGASVCADLSLDSEVTAIVQALRGVTVDLVAASPPCQPFSRAGRSKIRSLSRNEDAAPDERRELWRSVIEVVAQIRPRAVLVENVPGLAQGDDILVIAELIENLEDLGFDVYATSLTAREHGVPQIRERVFVVGVEPGAPFEWPQPVGRPSTVRAAISDLPAVEGGDPAEFREYGGPQTALQRWARAGVRGEDRGRVFDHFTRAVRADDLEAFRLMNHATKYSDLPEHLRRYRSDIFDDKYKRLHWDDVSRTITAHIGKDGYWYIHPDQHRTLTIREAARIQTFPDWFRFTGPPSHAFRQIGNAVPPMLATTIGRQILRALKDPTRQRERLSSLQLGSMLASWIGTQEETELAQPWRRSGDLWHTLLGIILFEKAKPAVTRDFWPTCARRWGSPEEYLSDPRGEVAVRAIGRTGAGALLGRVARAMVALDDPAAHTDLRVEGLSRERLSFAATLSGDARSFQPTPQTNRIASRVFETNGKRSKINEQLALVRFIGALHSGQAYGALLEIGDRFCLPSEPRCHSCPLRAVCETGQKRAEAHPVLFASQH